MAMEIFYVWPETLKSHAEKKNKKKKKSHAGFTSLFSAFMLKESLG